MDIALFSQIITYFQYHPFLLYALIFIIITVEGTVSLFIFAFLAGGGYINIFVLLLLATIGNEIADLFWYWLGKTQRQNQRINRYIHSQDSRAFLRLQKTARHHLFWFITVVKNLPSLTIISLLYLGTLSISFVKFVSYSTVINIVRAVVICSLGYFTIISLSKFEGLYDSYQKIGLGILVFIGLIVVYRYLAVRIWKKITFII